jgi:hypothetical protein
MMLAVSSNTVVPQAVIPATRSMTTQQRRRIRMKNTLPNSPWRKRSRGRHVLAARASLGTALSVAGDGETEAETP